MASLLDTIRGNLGQQSAQQAPMTNETERVRKLLGAKTGKAVSQADPNIAQSNLAEQAAVDQTRLGQQQLATQGQMQQQELAQTQQGLQQQEQIQRANIDLQAKANTLQNRVQTDQLLGDLSRDRASLDLDKDRAKLEQLSHNLALQDKQYIDNLQRMGQVNRLDDELSFKEQLTKAVFQDSTDLLNEDLARRAVDAQSARDWNMYLAKNNLAYLLSRDARQTKAANEAARWSAGSQILGAGIQAATSAGTSSSSPKSGPFTGDVNVDPTIGRTA